MVQYVFPGEMPNFLCISATVVFEFSLCFAGDDATEKYL